MRKIPPTLSFRPLAPKAHAEARNPSCIAAGTPSLTPFKSGVLALISDARAAQFILPFGVQFPPPSL
jgi:hypothetical protein